MPTRILLVALLGGATLALTPARRADLPAQIFPTYGGNGGTAFTRSCGAGHVMTGVRYRTGLSVDAIGPLCRPVRADGTLGAEMTPGTMAGGSGGTLGSSRCAASDVVFSASFYFGTYLDGMRLGCGEWLPATRQIGGFKNSISFGRFIGNTSAKSACSGSKQPVKSLFGRAASLVDAVGITCDEP